MSKLYQVFVTTEDHGDFKIKVPADNLREAESIALSAVRYQFSNAIISSHTQPLNQS
jgi:hypothetical protein